MIANRLQHNPIQKEHIILTQRTHSRILVIMTLMPLDQPRSACFGWLMLKKIPNVWLILNIDGSTLKTSHTFDAYF